MHNCQNDSLKCIKLKWSTIILIRMKVKFKMKYFIFLLVHKIMQFLRYSFICVIIHYNTEKERGKEIKKKK